MWKWNWGGEEDVGREEEGEAGKEGWRKEGKGGGERCWEGREEYEREG